MPRLKISDAPAPLAASCQLLRVIAPDWSSTNGELQRYARRTPQGIWQPVGSSIQITLGRTGLRWGLGRHPDMDHPAPGKLEGDGCSPAGLFAITALFGYKIRESAGPAEAQLPYFLASQSLKAVDDPGSRYYNRIVDQAELSNIDWHSHEDMLRQDERYTVGAVINHNPAPAITGAGSCIFLHVWAGPCMPTAGCTAGALSDIAEICNWLDARAAPTLAQLPRAEYERLRSPWGLP